MEIQVISKQAKYSKAFMILSIAILGVLGFMLLWTTTFASIDSNEELKDTLFIFLTIAALCGLAGAILIIGSKKTIRLSEKEAVKLQVNTAESSMRLGVTPVLRSQGHRLILPERNKIYLIGSENIQELLFLAKQNEWQIELINQETSLWRQDLKKVFQQILTALAEAS